jgi:ubiquinone/menaquinone biosynthesis C-methylase UbiE
MRNLKSIPLKTEVQKYWETSPCGSRDAVKEVGSKAFFEEVERNRYKREPFIHKFARFEAWKGKKVLEIGCGLGTDLMQFARSGAQVYGVDLTEKGVALTKKRLEIYGLSADVRQADAESLPFSTNQFDFVYSWGVIHHTPNIEAAVAEIYRVTKPCGKICIMIYHKWSLVSFQLYLKYGLLHLKPFASLDTLISTYMESPGTKAFDIPSSYKLFKQFKEVKVTPVVTTYDLRIARRVFLPKWLAHWVPAKLGWFLVIEGLK